MTKPKIYLSPAYHKANTCCYQRSDGQQCYETLHNNEYLDILELRLLSLGFDVKRGPRRTPMSNEDGTALMNQAIAESNSWGAKVHYVCHTNASGDGIVPGTARGYHVMYYSGSISGEKLARVFSKHRKEVYPSYTKVIARPSQYGGNLAELKNTTAVAVYQEHVFHDNAEDAAWFHEHMAEVAECDCKALCEWFGMTYAAPAGDAQSAIKFGLNYTKADGASWYVDGKEVSPGVFVDALIKKMEE